MQLKQGGHFPVRMRGVKKLQRLRRGGNILYLLKGQDCREAIDIMKFSQFEESCQLQEGHRTDNG